MHTRGVLNSTRLIVGTPAILGAGDSGWGACCWAGGGRGARTSTCPAERVWGRKLRRGRCLVLSPASPPAAISNRRP